MNDPAAVEAYLHKHIPISGEMGCRVIKAAVDEVVLEAPLEPNINHRSTAFGGSLSAIGILAGWALVHFNLRDAGAEVRTVIRDNTIRYDAPVTGAFQARCAAPDAVEWERFVRTVLRRGKGRIEVRTVLTSDGAEVGACSATYVALERVAADATVAG